MFALFNLGIGEIILILSLVLLMFGAPKLPELSRGLRSGFLEFRRAIKSISDEIDEEATEAGRSVGGIYGKPAAQALTYDNQVAELYDPAAFKKRTRPNGTRRLIRGLLRLWRRLRPFLRLPF
jgi:sec-independent protein translocase protein TatA